MTSLRILEYTTEGQTFTDYIKECQGEYANLELKKSRGYREFYEGYIDGVWFMYTPSLTQEVGKIEYLVPEDPDVYEKITNKKWAKAAYWRIINSVNYGYKKQRWRPTSFLDGEDYTIRWSKKDNTLTIKEKNND